MPSCAPDIVFTATCGQNIPSVPLFDNALSLVPFARVLALHAVAVVRGRAPPAMFRYIAFLGLHCSGGIRVESHMMGLISPPTDITFIEHMGGHYELGWKGERSTKHFMVLDFQQECFLCLYHEGNSINNLVISSF